MSLVEEYTALITKMREDHDLSHLGTSSRHPNVVWGIRYPDHHLLIYNRSTLKFAPTTRDIWQTLCGDVAPPWPWNEDGTELVIPPVKVKK